LVEAIYLFICYDVPNAADGWNRSLHSFSFSLSFSLRLRFSLEYACVSIAGLKKNYDTYAYMTKRQKKKRAANHYHYHYRHHPVFAQWFPRSLSRCSPRTAAEAHTKLILHILTRCACPSSVRMYIYTQMLLRVSHFTIHYVFIRVQYLRVFFNTHHFTVYMSTSTKRIAKNKV
jgi:hypothetical protein